MLGLHNTISYFYVIQLFTNQKKIMKNVASNMISPARSLEGIINNLLTEADNVNDGKPIEFIKDVLIFYMGHCPWLSDTKVRESCFENYHAILALLESCIEYSDAVKSHTKA